MLEDAKTSKDLDTLPCGSCGARAWRLRTSAVHRRPEPRCLTSTPTLAAAHRGMSGSGVGRGPRLTRRAARGEVEHGRGFRRLVKWRTGSEGRISYLKRRYGWDRTLFDTQDGAQTWCGLGVLAHNTGKLRAEVRSGLGSVGRSR